MFINLSTTLKKKIVNTIFSLSLFFFNQLGMLCEQPTKTNFESFQNIAVMLFFVTLKCNYPGTCEA